LGQSFADKKLRKRCVPNRLAIPNGMLFASQLAPHYWRSDSMAERANEPLLRRREPSAPSKLLTAELAAGLKSAAEPPAKADPARRPAASTTFSFLALLDALPSDYYLG